MLSIAIPMPKANTNPSAHIIRIRKIVSHCILPILKKALLIKFSQKKLIIIFILQKVTVTQKKAKAPLEFQNQIIIMPKKTVNVIVQTVWKL